MSDGGGPADKAAVEAGARGNLTATWGWYQDAGDWDAYISHQDVPLGLLLLYQLHPEKFTDGELNLPESGNGIPDIVDEGAWLPRFFHRQRAELLAKGWGTGGVGSRVFGDYWGSDRLNDIGRGSWEDIDRDWYVTGEDPFSTYRYAASAAQLADILAGLGVSDPEGVDWTAEARAAYAWAGAHIRAGDDAKAPHGTLREDRALAAVALYRLTGESEYHVQAQADLAGLGAAETGLSGARLSAVVLYLAMPAARPVDAALKARLLGALRASALHVTTASADRRACRWGGDFSMPMLVGQSSTPLIQAAVLGQRILEEHDAAAAADVLRVCHTTADYFLGGNPLHSTWITGLGERHPTGIFCMDDFYAGPVPRRGLMPYGTWRFPDGWIPQRMAYSIWWVWDTTYPSLDPRGPFQPASGARAPGTLPGHEAWFDNRNSPQTGEFTIHQDHLPAALAYGFLCAEATRPPSIVSGPTGATVEEGRPVTLRVVASDAGAISYQWRRDGWPVIDATTDTLLLPAAQTYDAGVYDVVVSGTRGSITSGPATVQVMPAASGGTIRAANISTRALCGVGEGILIPGFIIEGSGTRTLLVRAVGPRLGDFGVTGVLADPVMELTRISAPAGLVAVSDNWMESSDVDRIVSTSAAVGAFPLDGRSSGGMLDRWSSAAVVELAAGSYTPVCRGVDGGTGVALVEIYDAGGTGDARVVNLSNRGFVSVGDEVMIPGLVARGGGTSSYLVRAAGPALGGFGVSGYLANPHIRIVSYATGATVASNDNWSDQADQGDALLGVFNQVSAFPFARGSRDAALRVTVPEGLYTLVCRGYGDTSGVALVEVYEID